MHTAVGADQVSLSSELLGLAELMGLLQKDPEEWFTLARGAGDISKQDIEMLIAERQQAKDDKDYSGADQIRQSLLDQGVVLEDSRAGTQWRRS